MERPVFDFYGTTKPSVGNEVPISFAGIEREIKVPAQFVDQAGVSLLPGQDVVAGLREDGVIVDLAPAPRPTELEVV